MFGLNKETRIDRKQSLTGVPVVSDDVIVRQEAPDRMCLVVRRRRGTGLLARFQPPVMEKTVRLDNLGSFVFGLMDGRRPVRRIVDEFEKRYRVNRREAELSTVAFIKSLAERNVIAIVIPTGPDHG
jgi:hypothetical protein